jgi:Rod binding domain-containing protein
MVTQRLETLGAASGAEAPNFASALSAAGAMPQPAARPALASPPTVASRADKAQVQFEATLLNSFISEMMPKDASAVYGEGYAGDMWRSLLAEKIADQIAKSGSLGISKGLFAGNHSTTLDKLESASHANASQANVTLASANALSLPIAAEPSDGAYLFVRGKSL